MSTLKSWLSQKFSFDNSASFLDALQKLTSESDESADSFLEDLLSPLQLKNLITKYHASSFAADRKIDTLETTPQAAIEFIKNKLIESGTILADDAAVMAEAYLKLGNYGASDLACAVAYLEGSRTCTVLCMVAGLAIREQRHPEAREAVAECLRRYPERAEPIYYAALLALSEGKPAEAIDHLRDLTRRHPQYRPGWTLFLDALLYAREWEEARDAGRKATEAYPDDPRLWGRLAVAYWKTGDLDLGMQTVQAALETTTKQAGIEQKDYLFIQLVAAAIEEEMGQHERALLRYRNLLELQHQDPAVFVNAASCLRSANNPRDAVSMIQSGLALYPDNPHLHRSMGELLFEAGRYDEAFGHLEKAARLEPAFSGCKLLMAAIHLRERRFQNAIEVAEEVVRATPGRAPEAFTLIGDAYRFQGAMRSALFAYREAMRHTPDDAEITNRVRQVEAALQST